MEKLFKFNKLTLTKNINGVTVVLELASSEDSDICISEMDKNNVKNGVSIHYVKTKGGFVPLNLQVYETGVCGKSYSFDYATGIFTQFVEFSNGCELVGMDKRTINKHKSEADNYYKQAKNMLDEFTKSKCPFTKALLYNEFGITSK